MYVCKYMENFRKLLQPTDHTFQFKIWFEFVIAANTNTLALFITITELGPEMEKECVSLFPSKKCSLIFISLGQGGWQKTEPEAPPSRPEPETGSDWLIVNRP